MGKIDFILLIKNSAGKTLFYVTKDFKLISLPEAIKFVKKGKVPNTHLIKTQSGSYLRTNRNSSSKDNLANSSVSIDQFLKYLKNSNFKDKTLSIYLKSYGIFLEAQYKKSELIFIEGIARTPLKNVRSKIKSLKKTIFTEAKNKKIDPYLLTAILIDEIARIDPLDAFDLLGFLGKNTSVGIAQVKISTARELIKKKYYKENSNISSKKIYLILIDDKKAVSMAASYLRYVIDLRNKDKIKINASLLATSYSAGPLVLKASNRGRHISTTLYQLAKKILK